MVVHKRNQHFPTAVTNRRPLERPMMCILHPVLANLHTTAHTVALKEIPFFSAYTFCKSSSAHMATGNFQSANQNCQDMVSQYGLVRVNLTGYPAAYVCGSWPIRQKFSLDFNSAANFGGIYKFAGNSPYLFSRNFGLRGSPFRRILFHLIFE